MSNETLLKGAVPIVETSTDGSELAPILDMDLRLPDALREAGMLICGGRRPDRVERLLMPILRSDLRRSDASVVLIDTIGDVCAAARAEALAARGEGARIVYLNPTDPARSTGYNPLAGVLDRHEALRRVNVLVSRLPVGKEETSFWRNSVRTLLTEIICCLAASQGGNAALGDIRTLIEAGADAVGRFAREHGSAALQERVAYLREASNGQTTMMEVLNALGAWQDPNVCAVTSADELRVEELLEQPTLLVVHIPQVDGETCLPVLDFLFAELSQEVLRRAESSPNGKLPQPVSICLTDASVPGRIAGLSRKLEALGAAGVRSTVLAPSLDALSDTYGPEMPRLLAGLRSKVWVTPLGDTDAAYVSMSSGDMAVEEAETADGYATTRVGAVARKVLSPFELRAAPRHPVYGPPVAFLLDGRPPFWCFLPDRVEEAAGPRGAAAYPAREHPLTWEQSDDREAGGTPGNWDADETWRQIERAKSACAWSDAGSSARNWWEHFERANRNRPLLVYRVIDEVRKRGSTIQDFFLAYVYSNTDNIEAVFHYHDYIRAKKAAEKRRQSAAAPPESVAPSDLPHRGSPIPSDLTLACPEVSDQHADEDGDEPEGGDDEDDDDHEPDDEGAWWADEEEDTTEDD